MLPYERRNISIHRYSVGYKIDKQLLLSLKDIFEQYSEKSVLEIRVGCNNNASYVFDNVDECFEFLIRNLIG